MSVGHAGHLRQPLLSDECYLFRHALWRLAQIPTLAPKRKMRLRQYDSVGTRRGYRQRRPILQPQLLVSMEWSAIDQDACFIRFDKIFRAGEPVPPRKVIE